MKKNAKESVETPKTTMLDRLPNDRGEYLAVLIRLTERAIRYPDDHMSSQAKRLRAELEAWKKANPS